MDAIRLSANIARLRREQGLTQEALAKQVGVTKAAVSKWELAQSMPDVTLLPRVASLLGTTVDGLIGWEPQLSDDELRDLQGKLDERVRAHDRAGAGELLEREVRDHASCWPLLVLAAANLMGWAVAEVAEDGEADAERASDLRLRAGELLGRVVDRSRDAEALLEAQQLRASLLMQEGQLDEAEALLRPLMPRGVSQNVPMLLMSVCQAQGRHAEALELNQRQVLSAASSLIRALTMQAGLRERAEDVEELCVAVERAMEALGWERVNPLAATSLHLTAAQAFLRLGRKDAALDHAERALLATPAAGAARTASLDGLTMFDHLDGGPGGTHNFSGKPAEDYVAPAVAELLEGGGWNDGSGADDAIESRRQALIARARGDDAR